MRFAPVPRSLTHRSLSEGLELDVEVLTEVLIGRVELLRDEFPGVRAQRLVVHADADFGLEQTLLRRRGKLYCGKISEFNSPSRFAHSVC